MVDLYKFMRREYLQSFLDGQLYLNSIGFFWSHGFEKQSDFYEGASEMGSSCNMPFPDNLKKNIKGSVVYRLNAYKYCNVLCFYKQEYDPVKKQVLRVDKRMKPFGDVAVRIKYLNSFVDRVEDYAKAQKDDYCLSGPVNYHRRDENIETLDCFDKMMAFSWQKEWRIVYLKDYSKLREAGRQHPEASFEYPATINVGDLRDIVEVYETKDIMASPLNIYRGYKIVKSIEPQLYQQEPLIPESVIQERDFEAQYYRGWGDRHTFRDKVADIDGGYRNIMFSI